MLRKLCHPAQLCLCLRSSGVDRETLACPQGCVCRRPQGAGVCFPHQHAGCILEAAVCGDLTARQAERWRARGALLGQAAQAAQGINNLFHGRPRRRVRRHAARHQVLNLRRAPAHSILLVSPQAAAADLDSVHNSGHVAAQVAHSSGTRSLRSFPRSGISFVTISQSRTP
jgi:hypothetical protein